MTRVDISTCLLFLWKKKLFLPVQKEIKTKIWNSQTTKKSEYGSPVRRSHKGTFDFDKQVECISHGMCPSITHQRV